MRTKMGMDRLAILSGVLAVIAVLIGGSAVIADGTGQSCAMCATLCMQRVQSECYPNNQGPNCPYPADYCTNTGDGCRGCFIDPPTFIADCSASECRDPADVTTQYGYQCNEYCNQRSCSSWSGQTCQTLQGPSPCLPSTNCIYCGCN